MKRIPLFLVVAALVATASAQIKDKQVVGKWHYDVKTLKIELDAKGKQELAAAGEKGRAQFKTIMDALNGALLKLTFSFEKDHKFWVTMEGDKTTTGGKWSLKGRELVIVMDKVGQSVPSLTFDPSGNSIATVYKYPGFGVGKVTMIRK